VGVNDQQKTSQKAAQQRRLSAALRENLKRRKAQARGRAPAQGSEPDGTPHDSAGIAADKRKS
jgi:hypothetical protein